MPRHSRLDARPGAVTASAPVGLQPLELGGAGAQDSYLYVPASYDRTRPTPFTLMLHGSGGHAHHGLEVLQHLSEEAGFILAGPASSDYTWDVILSRHGAAAVVNGALEHVFARYSVDPAHVAIAGFSDGASRALSLGLANGDLFTHVIAFSPGFVLISEEIGRPRVLISHGTRDEVQPVAECSRRILAQTERMDLDVEYIEFEAGHRIPPDVARYAVDWFMESPGSSRERHPHRFPESRVPREG